MNAVWNKTLVIKKFGEIVILKHWQKKLWQIQGIHDSSEIRKLRNSVYRKHALHRALKITADQGRDLY